MRFEKVRGVGLFILIGLVAPVWALAKSPATGQIKAHSQKLSFFDLRWNAKALSYQSAEGAHRIELKPCNQAVVQSFLTSYDSNKKKSAPAPKSAKDVVQVQDERGRFQVASLSPLGRWLSQVPFEVKRVAVEAGVRCEKQK